MSEIAKKRRERKKAAHRTGLLKRLRADNIYRDKPVVDDKQKSFFQKLAGKLGLCS